MKKEAIIKMIDTFIRDLKEIRADVEKFEVSEDTEAYTQYTDDELATFIAKTLDGRHNKLRILDDAADLSNTLRIERKQKTVNVLTFTDYCNILDTFGYEYIIRPNTVNGSGKSIVFKDNYSGTDIISINFRRSGYVDSLWFSENLHIKKIIGRMT